MLKSIVLTSLFCTDDSEIFFLTGICYIQVIFQAVTYESEELLRELLEANPRKVYYRDNHGRSALHIAAQNGNIVVLDLLIKAGGGLFIQLPIRERVVDM